MNRSPHQGFTLIEVLVALSIIAIASLAAIKAVDGSIATTTHIQRAILGRIVGQNILANAQNGQQALPKPGGIVSGSESLLTHRLRWVLRSDASLNNPFYSKVEVSVYFNRQKQSVFRKVAYIWQGPSGAVHYAQ